MARIQRNNTNLNTLLATRGQVNALEDRYSQQAALEQNRRNYTELERKRKEQRDLRDKLAEIQAMGLPKEYQGELNYDVEQLVQKVRDGELDTQSYDFNANLQKILGKSARFEDVTNRSLKFASEDGQVVDFDENGNPIDIKGQYTEQFLSPWETEFDPNTPASEKIGAYYQIFDRQTAPLSIDDKQLDSSIKQFNELSVDEQVSLLGADRAGYLNKKTVAQLNPQERDNFVSGMLEANKAPLMSTYAKLRSQGAVEQPFKDWARTYITNRMPQQQVSMDVINDREFLTPEEQGRRARAAAAGAGAGEFDFGGGALTTKYNPKTRKIEQQRYVGLGDLTIGGKKVSGTTFVDGKELAVSPNGVMEDSEDVARAYKNAILKGLSDDEKTAYNNAVRDLRGTETLIQREPDQEKVKVVKDAIEENVGFFGDDETKLRKWVVDTYNISQASEAGQKFIKDLKTLLDDTDFESEDGKDTIAEFIVGSLPQEFVSEEEVTIEAPQQEEVETVVVEGTPDIKTWDTAKQYDYNNAVYYYDNQSKQWKKKTKS